MINRRFIASVFILFFFARHPAFAADSMVDPREAAIDRAIGGMIEGSRPLPPQNYAGKNEARQVPGSGLNPSMDTRVTASANAQSPSGSNGGTPTGGPTEPATEPTGSGSTNDSIINVDANVDLSGGTPTVDANLSVDTNAGGGLLDANATTTTGTVTTDVSATESGTLAGQDLTTAVETAPIDAIFDTEVVATDAPPESEATAGLEASVDETSAGSDVTPTDLADGLGI